MKRADNDDSHGGLEAGEGRKQARVSEPAGVRGNKPRQLDQFFTKPDVAVECVTRLQSVLKDDLCTFDLVLEPSFGDGAFVSALRAVGVQPPRLKFVDIDARSSEHRADFLGAPVVPKEYFHSKALSRAGSMDMFLAKSSSTTRPAQPCCITIGNPPFGKNSSLAIAFFNRAAEFSTVIAFVVPRTFSKVSVHNKLDLAFSLMYEYVLEEEGFLFKGEPYDVPCVFQVWIHGKYANLIRDDERAKAPMQVPKSLVRTVSKTLSETPHFIFVKPTAGPDFAIRRVGVNAGRIFEKDVTSCSEQSHLFLKVRSGVARRDVLRNLKSLDLEKLDCKLQTAGNPSISKSELCTHYINFIKK